MNFYDGATDIIAAESLAQISSNQRRKWAQKLFEIFTKDSNILQLIIYEDENDTNEFSKRLVTESWTPLVAVFEMIHAQATLHIYRFYYLYLKHKYTDAILSPCVMLTPSDCD